MMEWQNDAVCTVIVLYTVMNRSKMPFVLFSVVATAYRPGVCAAFSIGCGTGISFIERKMAWKTVDVSVALDPNRSEPVAWWEGAG